MGGWAAARGAVLMVWVAPWAAHPQGVLRELQLPTAGCARLEQGHEGETVEYCGYRSVALDDTGSRILTIDVAGKVVLFDGAGAEVSAHDTGLPGQITEAFFAGGRAIALVGPGLLALDPATGDALYDRRLQDDAGRLLQVVQRITHRSELLFLTAAFPASASSHILAVDLATGEVVRVESKTLVNNDFPARQWTVGYAVSERHAPRFEILRADRDLSRLDLGEGCNTLGPIPKCVAFDLRTSSGAVIDVATGDRMPFDVKALIGATSLVDWIEVGARTLGVFRVGAKPTGVVNEFVIVDVGDSRELWRFSADRYRMLAGADESGAAELRIAVAPQHVGGPYVVRRVSMTGEVAVLGEVPYVDDVVLAASDPSALPALRCGPQLIGTPYGPCVVSGDGTRLALIDREGGVSVFAMSQRD